MHDKKHIEGYCEHCGWPVAAEGITLSGADALPRPDTNAKPHRCDDTACTFTKGSPVDEWKDTWDWARKIWGDAANTWGSDGNYSFNAFFRDIACKRAEAEGWEEVGSSDVWHASYDVVKRIKAEGKVKTREQLTKAVRDWMGY